MQTTTQFKIEKGIPFPKPRNKGVTELLRKMEAGDSVLLTPTTGIHSCAKQIGIKIAIRREGKKVRAWKLA